MSKNPKDEKLVSREAVKELLENEYAFYLKGCKFDMFDAIDALPGVPVCEDAVSRNEVLNLFTDYLDGKVPKLTIPARIANLRGVQSALNQSGSGPAEGGEADWKGFEQELSNIAKIYREGDDELADVELGKIEIPLEVIQKIFARHTPKDEEKP